MGTAVTAMSPPPMPAMDPITPTKLNYFKRPPPYMLLDPSEKKTRFPVVTGVKENAKYNNQRIVVTKNDGKYINFTYVSKTGELGVSLKELIDEKFTTLGTPSKNGRYKR